MHWTFFVANSGHGARRNPRSQRSTGSVRPQPRPDTQGRAATPVLRHPAYIYRRRRVAAIMILVFLLLLVLFIAGACGPGPTRTLQGDQLGPEPEESAEQYQTRAATSVEEARDETYALVTFTEATDSEVAAEAVDGAQRVNAVISEEDFVPIDLPEPIEGETRIDVLERAIGEQDINSVIVWDEPDVLAEIATRDMVFAVESAPSDAAWGSFGIRPVMNLEAVE